MTRNYGKMVSAQFRAIICPSCFYYIFFSFQILDSSCVVTISVLSSMGARGGGRFVVVKRFRYGLEGSSSDSEQIGFGWFPYLRIY